VEQALGGLFVSGWTVDDLLDLTWDQVQLVAGCVVEYRSMQLNTIMEIVTSAIGGTVESKAKTTGRKKHKSKSSKKPAEKRDAASQFAALGFPVSIQGAT